LDNLTHSLFGLTLARTPLGRGERAPTIALLLASNVPDIDILATAGGAAKYLEWHRGPTHGVLGVIGLGFIAALLVWSGDRFWNKTSTSRTTIGRLWVVSMVAVAFHILMDLPTSYGTRLLSPFAWTWLAEDWEPIVDIYLLAILGAGLWFGRASIETRRPASLRPPRAGTAAIALTLMLVNYGVRAVAHHQAIVRAPQIFGAQLPPPCENAVSLRRPIERWPIDSSSLAQGRSLDSANLAREQALDSSPLAQVSFPAPVAQSGTGRCLVEIAAMPDFVSPFRWRLIAHLSNAYEVRTVDLLASLDAPPRASDVRLIAVHYPNLWTPAVLQAARSPIAQRFLGFSRFPAARSIVAADGTAIVRWTDLRFTSETTPGIRERAPNLFGATIELDAAGNVLRARLGS
jgi:membrane-bound metal-dependent hydrolase YbcI (DUF457 family)